MPNIHAADRRKAPRASTPRVNCPHCDAPAVTRSVKLLSPLLRDIYYWCTNIACGHTFVAALEIVRTVTPSVIPRPGVRLPMQERGSHRPIFPPAPANDDTATPVTCPDTG